MNVNDVLTEVFGRLPALVEQAVTDLDAEQLATAPGPNANTIGWLVWHLARGQDSQVAALIDEEQLWVSGPWAPRFGLQPDPSNTGYGHSPEEAAAVRPDGPDVLIEYYGAVHERTTRFLANVTSQELDRVIDDSWDPPVTVGIRLVSIADDDIQHAGQAAYAHGLLAP